MRVIETALFATIGCIFAFHVAAQAMPAPDSAARQAEMLPYYPPSARAAGIEGEATLKCMRPKGGSALINCKVVSERPANEGFGDAALDITRHVENLQDDEDVGSPPIPIAFKFGLNPPSITPPVLEHPHVITNPDWLRKPSAADMRRVYPTGGHPYPSGAAAKKQSGHAVMNCIVDVSGNLTHCAATGEPPGAGFDEAALKMAGLFTFRPRLLDGMPIGGGTVQIPIDFAWQNAIADGPDLEAIKAGIDPASGPPIRTAVFRRTPARYREYGPPGPYYPDRAARMGMGGAAVLQCSISTPGKLNLCEVQTETTKGYGFADAALKMAAVGYLSALPVPGAHDGDVGRILVEFKSPHLRD